MRRQLGQMRPGYGVPVRSTKKKPVSTRLVAQRPRGARPLRSPRQQGCNDLAFRLIIKALSPNAGGRRCTRFLVTSRGQRVFLAIRTASPRRAMADIFISYAREDKEKARRLAQAVADQGWSVWWDWHIRSGRRFHQVIERELTAARCVIALWSKAALSSSWVREEAQDGLDRAILVPVRIEVIPLPIGFRTVQTADLIGWEGDQAHPDFAQLIEDITALLGEFPKKALGPEAKPEKPAESKAEREAKKPVERRLDLPPLRGVRLGDLPGLTVFRDIDAPWCPEMVALPVGSFLMGSPKIEERRNDNEGPQHRVTIRRRFAIGQYPVTFAQYDHFCAMKREKPGDAGWERGKRPVINVSWWDATAYCDWLAKETGQPYRLPSEAEWEYACRAGTTTRYAFGDAITLKDANYTFYARHVYPERGMTTEVGSYPPNAWGIYDMHGNVWEWVEDVWHRSYKGAPDDGAAWTDGEGKTTSRYRVSRGGCWRSSPEDEDYHQKNTNTLRSACRCRDRPDDRDDTLGFRIARTLD